MLVEPPLHSGGRNMANSIKNLSKSAIRTVIKFLVNGQTKTQDESGLDDYGISFMSKRQVCQWCSMFETGRIRFDHAQRGSRGKAAPTNTHTQKCTQGRVGMAAAY